MRAVVLRNGRQHWLRDGVATLCGRNVIELPVDYEYEPESIHPDRVCPTCRHLYEHGTSFGESYRVTLPPSLGKLYRNGPLNPSPTATRHGEELR